MGMATMKLFIASVTVLWSQLNLLRNSPKNETKQISWYTDESPGFKKLYNRNTESHETLQESLEVTCILNARTKIHLKTSGAAHLFCSNSRYYKGMSAATAAAAAKSLQSCPTLCDPTDGCPPGSPIAGFLQARTLEWVAISFSKAWKWKVKVKSLSRVQLLATPWTAAYQAPPSMGFSRQKYWSGVPLPREGKSVPCGSCTLWSWPSLPGLEVCSARRHLCAVPSSARQGHAFLPPLGHSAHPGPAACRPPGRADWLGRRTGHPQHQSPQGPPGSLAGQAWESFPSSQGREEANSDLRFQPKRNQWQRNKMATYFTFCPF